MKVELYLDLFKKDFVANIKMLKNIDDHILAATNVPYSKTYDVTRLKIVVDLPDKYFIPNYDEIIEGEVEELIEEITKW